RVTSVTAPATVLGGQSAVVEWTITNTGTGATRSASGGWFDAVFLSPDGQLDGNDVLLGSREHVGDLGAGASYEASMQFAVPAFASGKYVFLVQTDRRNDVYEHLAELNNVSSAETELALPAPADLVVHSIAVPGHATPGEPVLVTWTLANEGTNPARGVMREVVFVSEDAEWDIDDPILGTLEREIDLAPGAQQAMMMSVDVLHTYKLQSSGEVSEILPGIPPGAYY